MKHEHQIRFQIECHVFLISNNDGALDIAPNDHGVRAKRRGWRMMNRFVDAQNPAIDNSTVFAQELDVRNRIGDVYWVSVLRMLHMYYHEVMGPTKISFNTEHTDFAIEFPQPASATGMDHFANLFEVYEPEPGEDSYSVTQLYGMLRDQHGLAMTDTDFFLSPFKALLLQKIKAFRAKQGTSQYRRGGPRYASPRSGASRFYGIRLHSTNYESE